MTWRLARFAVNEVSSRDDNIVTSWKYSNATGRSGFRHVAMNVIGCEGGKEVPSIGPQEMCVARACACVRCVARTG